MLTKTLGRSKVEEFCAEIGQTEPRAETVDKEFKGATKPKEVKVAVETMEMDETVKNNLKDARIAKAKNKFKDARIAKIKNESKVGKLQWVGTNNKQRQKKKKERTTQKEDGTATWQRRECAAP